MSEWNHLETKGIRKMENSIYVKQCDTKLCDIAWMRNMEDERMIKSSRRVLETIKMDAIRWSRREKK